MERSFARATRYGFDRARWRGLWRMQIQEYLVCAIQNIQVFINCMLRPKKGATAISVAAKTSNLCQMLPSVIFFLNFALASRNLGCRFDFQRA